MAECYRCGICDAKLGDLNGADGEAGLMKHYEVEHPDEQHTGRVMYKEDG